MPATEKHFGHFQDILVPGNEIKFLSKNLLGHLSTKYYWGFFVGFLNTNEIILHDTARLKLKKQQHPHTNCSATQSMLCNTR